MKNNVIANDTFIQNEKKKLEESWADVIRIYPNVIRFGLHLFYPSILEPHKFSQPYLEPSLNAPPYVERRSEHTRNTTVFIE